MKEAGGPYFPFEISTFVLETTDVHKPTEELATGFDRSSFSASAAEASLTNSVAQSTVAYLNCNPRVSPLEH